MTSIQQAPNSTESNEYTVRPGEFGGQLIFAPIEDITTYELAKLTTFIAHGVLSLSTQERFLNLPKNVLRHILVNGHRLSEVKILPEAVKEKKKSFYTRLKQMF